MFSSTAEYALRAIAYLAAHPDELTSSQDIAKATKSPPGYVSKVLKSLADAGIVDSRRGPNGGFTLARKPRSLTVLEVINAVDPIKRIEACPLGLPAHKKLCRLHRRLDDAIAMVEKAFAATTIDELIDPKEAGAKAVFPTVSARKA